MRAARPPARGHAHPARGRRIAAARMQRLAAAAQEADRLRGAVIRAAPDAIVISDGDGRIREVNPAAEALFGLPASRLVGRWMSELVRSPEPRTAAGAGNILAALGRRVALEGVAADGSTFPTEVTVERVGCGRRVRFAAFLRNLTAERETVALAEAQQQRLSEIEKLSAMGSLLSGVAHELNNPLAILAAQATLLQERAPNPDVERRAERIQAAAQRAGRIVKGFVALATRRPARRAPFALADAFAEAHELVGYGLRGANIAVSIAFEPDLPRVEGDHDLLVQVFANLLLNAQEALAARPSDRRITVRSRRDPAGVAVEVADNGPGVAPAVAERLFEPYVTTKPAGAGLGIGLSLCRSVLTQLGGTIAHRSSRDGAAFSIVLPKLAVEREPQADPPKRSGGLSVLVVDDEVDVARSLAELIEIFGHRVTVATSAAEALARLTSASPDIVFTDYRMPGLDGTELRRRIAERDPGLATRTVLVTGDTLHRAGLADPAGTPMLAKPFTAAEVKAVLARLADP